MLGNAAPHNQYTLCINVCCHTPNSASLSIAHRTHTSARANGQHKSDFVLAFSLLPPRGVAFFLCTKREGCVCVVSVNWSMIYALSALTRRGRNNLINTLHFSLGRGKRVTMKQLTLRRQLIHFLPKPLAKADRAHAPDGISLHIGRATMLTKLIALIMPGDLRSRV